MNDPAPAMKRRNFFGLLGGGVSYGTMLVAGEAAAGELRSPVQERAQALPLGVIVPRSHLRPELGPAFRAGLELALAGQLAQGRALSPVVEEVEVGGGGHAAALARLLGQHQPRIVLAMLDARLAGEAARQCGGGTLLIDCSAGAIVPAAPAPGLRLPRLTLGHWQSAYALGCWAARQGRRAAIVSTFYDAGYDGLYAFRLGFEEGGGSLAPTVVIDVPNRHLGCAAAIAQAAASAPDVVYAAVHGHQSGPFMSAWAQSPLSGDALLVGNPFLAEYAQGHAQRTVADGLVVCATYDPALDLEHNLRFRARYQEQHGRLPDAFAALGYEAGLLAVQTLRQASPGADAGGLAASALACALDGPRGRITFDAASGSSVALHSVTLCRWSEAGAERRIIARLPAIPDGDPRIAALQGGLRSGWVNPYMSV